jgi:hypothetical protein
MCAHDHGATSTLTDLSIPGLPVDSRAVDQSEYPHFWRGIGRYWNHPGQYNQIIQHTVSLQTRSNLFIEAKHMYIEIYITSLAAAMVRWFEGRTVY